MEVTKLDACCWANNIFDRSEKLTKVAFLPRAMINPEITLDLIAAIFKKFSSRNVPQIRAWSNGGQQYTAIDELLADASRQLCLFERLARATRSENFCVTLNGLSSWCETFTLQMQTRILQPLFAQLGAPPVSGVDFYAFFGNYGFTPFGVHDDIDESFLWHLGPSKKIAYVWPRQSYEKLTGHTRATLSYQNLLTTAEKFELNPGDLLFIPKGDFHVLETQGFSVTLGLTLFPNVPERECEAGLRLLSPNFKTLTLVGDKNLKINELIMLRKLSLESNGYIVSAPQLLPEIKDMTLIDTLHGPLISARKFFPLRQIRIAGREALIVRRRVIWAKQNALFPYICDYLNACIPAPYPKIMEGLSKYGDQKNISDVLVKIHALEGLSIEKY